MKNLKKIALEIINSALAVFHIQVRSTYSGGRLFAESFTYLKEVLPLQLEKTIAVIDIGVADGTPELWSAFPASQYKYLLIEANPAYADTVEKFGKKMDAIVEKVFCGDHDGTETFITDSSYDPGKASKYGRENGGKEKRAEIPCLKLDTILKRHKLPESYILKIDVEGAEMDVLRGATDTLSKTEAVIVEAPITLRKNEAASFSEITSFMHQIGFAVFDIAEMSYHRNGFLNLSNIIFVKKDNRLWKEKASRKAK